MWWKILLIGQLLWATGDAFFGSDRVRLRDISAITLHKGQMTTGRRSSPVPQLKCVGGTAGSHSFSPQTVQCRNVGFDGYDVQWECKADMDDSYRFGNIQVSCEGYDYPEDEYILKGSCGLEYTLDYTEAGRSRQNSYDGGYNYVSQNRHDKESSGSWFLFFIVVGAVVFLICKMGSNASDDSQSHQQRGQPFRSGHHNSHSSNSPPPYGFKPEYSQQGQDYCPPPSYTDATGTHTSHSSTTTNTSPVGGFWSGLGLGSVAGYLFGNRRRNYGYGYGASPGYGWNSGWGRNRGWGSSWGSSSSGWGGGSWGSGSSGWGSSSWGGSGSTYRRSGTSSGTSRTASGFGGTKRR